MPLVIDPTIVKIAVELEDRAQLGQLIKFDQKSPLTVIIENLCQHWNFSDCENYALQFYESKTMHCDFVTETNRNEVKNGSRLRLRHSAAKTVHDMLETLKLHETTINKNQVLEHLATLSSDLTFALEFIKEQGMSIVISMIESDSCIGNTLKFVMLSFVELMDHDTVSWDILELPFISRNIHFINNRSSVPIEVVQCALCVLENVVQNSSTHVSVIERDVEFNELLCLLRDSSQIIQQNTIALINALFSNGDDKRRQSIANTLSAKPFRAAFMDMVLSDNIGISHQLYVLQTLTLGLLTNQMMTKFNDSDQNAHDKIKELRQIAFVEALGDSHPSYVPFRRKSLITNARYYDKLGFTNDTRSIETPPGVYALDCMVYFARNYTQQYTKVVHENSCRTDEHVCPFGRTSIELVKLLGEILHIGETPTQQGQEFHAMFFTHDHPFEEFFCICIVILNKTWKEMRATIEDLAKVMKVVREQIDRSLKSKPSNLDDFRSKIDLLNYADITALRQHERTSKTECELTTSAIVQLKEKTTAEIIALIKAQRLGYLTLGTRFSKYTRGTRSKNKFWYAMLCPNHKTLYYGDCDERIVPTLKELGNKIEVFEMRQLLIGKECPHMKELRARKLDLNLGFSITFVKENMEIHSTLDFVAPNEMIFNYWTDAINALLDLPMTSKKKDEDFETLQSMEMKLRLLDTDGVDICQHPPPIPDDPENYDFSTIF